MYCMIQHPEAYLYDESLGLKFGDPLAMYSRGPSLTNGY